MPAAKKDMPNGGYLFYQRLQQLSSLSGAARLRLSIRKFHSLPETRGNKAVIKGLVRDNDGEFPMILKQFASWWRFYPLAPQIGSCFRDWGEISKNL